jgi:plasmid stability protein
MATVQIRNLSDDAYAVLKRRAQESGRSLQEYLRLELERQATRKTVAEVVAQVRVDMAWQDGETGPAMEDIVDAIREGRDR